MALSVLQILLFLVTLIVITSSLKCYSGVTVCNGKPPKSTENCSQTHYCARIISALNYESPKVYGCDDGTCKADGCYTDLSLSKQICCCSKDLCNSSNVLNLLAVIAVAALCLLRNM